MSLKFCAWLYLFGGVLGGWGVLGGCGQSRRAEVRPVGDPAGVAPLQLDLPEAGVLRLFQVAEKGEGPPRAPLGAQPYVSLVSAAGNEIVLAGEFSSVGLEFMLAPGDYLIRTWFRPYEQDLSRGVGPTIGECEGKTTIMSGETVELVRVQSSWDTCRFEYDSVPWKIALRPRFLTSEGSWWLRMSEMSEVSGGFVLPPVLEYKLPGSVVGVLLNSHRTRTKKWPVQLHFGRFSGLDTEPSKLRACVMKRSGCEDLSAESPCEVVIRAEELEWHEPSIAIEFELLGTRGGVGHPECVASVQKVEEARGPVRSVGKGRREEDRVAGWTRRRGG